MRLVAGLLIFGAALATVAMWDVEATWAWATDAVMVGVVLGTIVAVGLVGRWLRQRQRRRMLGLRDSALW